MRTGRSIMALQGHVQGILTMDFSPDGFHLATGSEDHSCRIWDLRKRGCVYTLPAHKSLISQVSLGLLLGTEAPVMTPNGVDLSFVDRSACMLVQHSKSGRYS